MDIFSLMKKTKEGLLNKSREAVIAVQLNADVKQSLRISRGIQATAMLGALGVSTSSYAATLREATTDIFNYLYGIVGVLGAIFVLLALINWASGKNFLNREDPKSTFFTALFATMGAFGVVGILQWGKDIVAPDDYSIDDL